MLLKISFKLPIQTLPSHILSLVKEDKERLSNLKQIIKQKVTETPSFEETFALNIWVKESFYAKVYQSMLQ